MMLGDDLYWYSWAAIFAAIIATFMWRALGVLIYKNVRSDSWQMQLINMLAYSLVGAVMMQLMLEPTGLLATSLTSHRIIGLLIGVGLLVSLRKLPIALLGAIGSFAILSLFFQ